MDFLRVAGAQLNLVVGDLEGNHGRIAGAMAWAEDQQADVLLLPELALTGYPPEDLLIRPAFIQANLDILRRLAASAGDVVTVVGFADRVGPVMDPLEDAAVRCVANAAALLYRGEIRGVYHKVLLPNYGVFDEARYFAEGADEVVLWRLGGVLCGVSICEDIWSLDGPPSAQAEAGAQVLLNINGSPYHVGKGAERAELLRRQAVHSGVPVVYLNTVGGQDELVFDGDSMVIDGSGALRYRAAQFAVERFLVDVPVGQPNGAAAPVVDVSAPAGRRPDLSAVAIAPRLDDVAEVYLALVTGLGDYVRKNGFDHVVIGLSGGIDSSLTAAIAVDALGADHVWGITMPARYSSEGSVSDSRRLAANLGCKFDELPIEDVFTSFLDTLEPVFTETDHGVAEENLQARIRGAALMAVSNKFGGMVVTTGNKSEMGVGYATLYGDMVGGFAVLKDVYKTMVYRLAAWRNRDGEVIPQTVIAKEPSAELRPDQRDSDTLPPYDVLDEILVRYVELDRTVAEIAAEGFDEAVTDRVAAMVDRNEYKRRQAAPGVKITKKAFGRDRRLPITNQSSGWR
jgi:NAD+ synthase (glutamine-hydrolysing)